MLFSIITEMHQQLTLDPAREHLHGIELRVIGGPDEGCIYLTPMLLAALSEACARASKDLAALDRPQYSSPSVSDAVSDHAILATTKGDYFDFDGW